MPNTESIVLGMNKRKIFLDEDYLLLEMDPFGILSTQFH